MGVSARAADAADPDMFVDGDLGKAGDRVVLRRGLLARVSGAARTSILAPRSRPDGCECSHALFAGETAITGGSTHVHRGAEHPFGLSDGAPLGRGGRGGSKLERANRGRKFLIAFFCGGVVGTRAMASLDNDLLERVDRIPSCSSGCMETVAAFGSWRLKRSGLLRLSCIACVDA